MNIRKLLTRLVSLALIAVFLPTVAMADTWYLEDGSITVSATESGQNVSQGGVTKEDSGRVECIRLHRVMYFIRARRALNGYSFMSASLKCL